MRILKLALILSAAALGGAAIAQTGATPAPAPAPGPVNADRLFLGFAEDATLIKKQWWEVQLDYEDGSSGYPWDKTLVRGVLALNPIPNLELGGRVGFGSTDADPGTPDGTGATDLEVFGKYLFGSDPTTQFAAGGIVTIPTGDDGAGLGTDSFSFKAFGSMRHQFKSAILAANAGFRFNSDGQVGEYDPDGEGELKGKSSASFGLGMLFPISKAVTLLAEFGYETERFEGTDSDARVLGGINWRPQDRGTFRAALAAGLADGAPDFQVLLGYAWRF